MRAHLVRSGCTVKPHCLTQRTVDSTVQTFLSVEWKSSELDNVHKPCLETGSRHNLFMPTEHLRLASWTTENVLSAHELEASLVAFVLTSDITNVRLSSRRKQVTKYGMLAETYWVPTVTALCRRLPFWKKETEIVYWHRRWQRE